MTDIVYSGDIELVLKKIYGQVPKYLFKLCCKDNVVLTNPEMGYEENDKKL